MYKKRIDICSSCEKFEIYLNNNIYRCGECKCILNIKARIRNQECPLGKWVKENSNIQSTECGGC